MTSMYPEQMHPKLPAQTMLSKSLILEGVGYWKNVRFQQKIGGEMGKQLGE